MIVTTLCWPIETWLNYEHMPKHKTQFHFIHTKKYTDDI